MCSVTLKQLFIMTPLPFPRMECCQKIKIILLVSLLFIDISLGQDIEEIFNPNSDEISFQRKYIINVANKAEDCYFISNVQVNQKVNFHFVVRYFN